MRAVIHEWLAVVACLSVVLCVILIAAVNDLEQRLGRLHLTYTQQCMLDSDDMTQRTAGDCEKRWRRALKP